MQVNTENRLGNTHYRKQGILGVQIGHFSDDPFPLYKNPIRKKKLMTLEFDSVNSHQTIRE